MNDMEQLKRYIRAEHQHYEEIYREPATKGDGDLSNTMSVRMEVLEDVLLTISTIEKNAILPNPHKYAICEDVGLINFMPMYSQVPGTKRCPYCFEPED